MCLIAFAWNAHPDYRLIVGANRDEWHDRPAAPAAWWADFPQILAGRDLKAGGTWMGVTRTGRFGAITNFRDPSDKCSTARSRGELVTAFLSGDATPSAFLLETKQHAHAYNGFNLVVGDRSSLAYFSSRDRAIQILEPGVYALSNHMLNEPWPKVTMAKSAMEALLQTEKPENVRPSSRQTPLLPGEVLGMRRAIYESLSNKKIAPDSALPDTGVGIAWERILSPALIVTAKYGTRASTILSMENNGHVSFEEHTRAADGTVGHIAAFSFELLPV